MTGTWHSFFAFAFAVLGGCGSRDNVEEPAIAAPPTGIPTAAPNAMGANLKGITTRPTISKSPPRPLPVPMPPDPFDLEEPDPHDSGAAVPPPKQEMQL